MEFTFITLIYAVFFAIHQIWEIFLNRLDKHWIETHGQTVPSHLEGKMDDATFQKSISYNIEVKNFGLISRLYEIPIHWAFILFGFGFLDTTVRSLGLGDYLSGVLFIFAYGIP